MFLCPQQQPLQWCMVRSKKTLFYHICKTWHWTSQYIYRLKTFFTIILCVWEKLYKYVGFNFTTHTSSAITALPDFSSKLFCQTQIWHLLATTCISFWNCNYAKLGLIACSIGWSWFKTRFLTKKNFSTINPNGEPSVLVSLLRNPTLYKLDMSLNANVRILSNLALQLVPLFK